MRKLMLSLASPMSYYRQGAELNLNSGHLTLEMLEISESGRFLCH